MKISPYPWSHSSLSQYLTCPRQYQALRVTKEFPREESEQSIWGNQVHGAFEDYLKEGKPLPERMKQFQDYIDSLACDTCELYVELELGVLNDGVTACSFYDENCWSRCVVDYLRKNKRKALVLDHKTGRRREGSSQLKQNAAIIFANFPDLDELITGYAWLQEGGKIGGKEIYKREDVPTIWQSFERDLERLEWSFKNNAWPTQPSGLCKNYCNVTSCLHNGRRGR